MKDINVNMQSADDNAVDQLDKRTHALAGTVLLLSTSNFGGGAGVAPIGEYCGFITGSTAPTISAITYVDKTKHLTAGSEMLNSLGFVAGRYYPISGIKTVTITGGAMLLIRQ